jgi:hypothetical protein
MKPAPRHRRGLALLALLAVALNALAGAFHARPLATAGVVDDILGPLTICSPASAGDRFSPKRDNAPANNAEHRGDCPLCLRASALVLLPDVPEIVAPQFAPPAVLALSHERLPVLSDHLNRGGIRSRAPPAAA